MRLPFLRPVAARISTVGFKLNKRLHPFALERFIGSRTVKSATAARLDHNGSAGSKCGHHGARSAARLHCNNLSRRWALEAVGPDIKMTLASAAQRGLQPA